MGLNDAQEMLDAAKAQSVIDERRIALLERRLYAVRRIIATTSRSILMPNGVRTDVVDAWQLEQILDAPDDEPNP